MAMLIIAIVPVIVAIVGLLMYVLSSNAKVAELGRIAFYCGLFVSCLIAAHDKIKLG